MFIDLPHTAAFYGFNPMASIPTEPLQQAQTPLGVEQPIATSPEHTPRPYSQHQRALSAHEYLLDLQGLIVPHKLLTHHPGPLGLPVFRKPRENPFFTRSADHLAQRIAKAKASGKKVIVFLGCGVAALEAFAAAKRNPDAFVIGIDDRDNAWFSDKNAPFNVPKKAFNPQDMSIDVLLGCGQWQQLLQQAPQASIDEFWVLCPVGNPGDQDSYSNFTTTTTPSQLAHLLSANGTINVLSEYDYAERAWSENTDFDYSGLVMSRTGPVQRSAAVDHELYITYSPQFAR